MIIRQPMCVFINPMYPRHGPGQGEGRGGLGGHKGCGGHCWSDLDQRLAQVQGSLYLNFSVLLGLTLP